ncbi:MAG TPA: C25 family cysteine peptidase [Chitinophagales bacterium]|nr:C25 family cysteine peptidase [Chitinophagales bacterium]
MKKILLFFFLLAGIAGVQAQPTYGNEWVDATRPHYKFTSRFTAIHRISYNALLAHIPNLQLISKNSFVLFRNGKALPIYISGTGTTMTSNDYIEFYGIGNTGDIDSLFYRTADDQINPDISLFTDEAVYFLTTNNLPNNPRLTFASNNLTNHPPKDEYYMHREKVTYNTANRMYYPGKYYSVGQTETYKPIYDIGEGYTDKFFFGVPLSVTLSDIYTQGPNAIFRTNYTNNSYEQHNVRIRLNNNQVYPASGTQDAYGFKLNRVEVPVSTSVLVNGTNTFEYNDIGPATSSHKNVIGSVSLEYPRQFTFNTNGISIELDSSSSNKYIEINAFDNSSQLLLYDVTNGRIYRANEAAGVYPAKFNLEPSALKRQVVIRADNVGAVRAVTASDITPVNFTDFTNTNNQGEYYIVTHSSLLADDGTGNYWVEEYRKYRDRQENPATGKFTQARIVDIEQLYDQFGYGIRKSPLGLRNFINYMAKSTAISLKTKYIFLIGKGREAPSYRDTLFNPTGSDAYAKCLIPTFGYPGSDNLLAASRESDIPCVAIGRLAATNVAQVRDYLAKIKLYEEQQNSYVCAQPIAPKDWQKNVLHFSGGTTPSEQFIFKYYVDNYRKIVEDSLWGCTVTSFSKTSNNPIDVSLSQVIKDKINAGASWITFFGHSATGAFDFSIDEPENYNNSPKFPIILSNGCFSGFIHDAGEGYSERFVLGPDRGAIAFMATSSLSVSSGLNNFSDRLYKNISVNTYNQPLGDGVKKTLSDLFSQQNPAIDDYTAEIAYEMTLHGDPGLKPNQYPKPDFAIEPSSVFTTPVTVDAASDSFDINVVVTNLGKSFIRTIDAAIDTATRDTISVSLKRTIFDAGNNPVYYYYSKKMLAPFYKDTIKFTLPVTISTLGYGQNLFEPMVDAGFAVVEMAECNNTLTAPFTTYIQSDDVIPIYPYEFAIVPEKGVTLKASTVNPFAPLRAYRIQIDTSELFNSPKKRETVVTQVGGVVRWTTDAAYYEKDSTVYYWRIQRDTANAGWHYSSFIYLQGEYPGWNQSHQYQYLKDSYQNMRLDSTDRIFKFPSNSNNIHVRTGVANAAHPNGNVDYSTLGWDYNNYNEYRYRMGGCGYLSGGLTFAVIDPVTGLPWISHNYNPDNYGDHMENVHCAGKGDQPGFDFPTTGTNGLTGKSWSTEIDEFIDTIPAGHYVLVYSVNFPAYTSWDATLVTALGKIGFVAQPFTSGAVDGHLVYFTQKGNPNYNSFLSTSNGAFSIIDTSFNFAGSWFQGNFTSPKIGPAVEWRSVHWERQALNGVNTDQDSLDIIGVKADGEDTLLLTTGTANNLFYNGGPTIDPVLFPYLKLRLRTVDATLYTPTQLYYWRVLYKKPPEAAINPAAVATLNYTPNVIQGSNFHLEIPLENVTEVPMDSMLTKYVIRDALLNNINFNIRYDSLPGLQTMMLVLDQPVTANNYLGLNRVIIEANPDNDQIEQYHFNNIAELNFNVTGDKINPLLDVTFDNQHILNGDIISAKPTILITLKDENKYLALNNSDLIDVYIKYPGAAEPTKMIYDDVIMKFYPADSNTLAVSNKAQVELKPIFTTDGTYELLVKNRDRSGNNSATTDARFQGTPATFFDYKISFEVITKAMVTNVLNYPNPFTTSTKFVFTITGSEVPDVFKIQIMNIKGTVVKEVFKEELGPLHIGRNITEYAWDGRDQYGDLLANGIYFYHVATRLEDKEMEKMSMSYDKYFKKGFGKMAIIR